MKNSTWIAFGVGIVSAFYFANKTNKEQEMEVATANLSGLVNLNGSFYSINDINAQNGNLNLTASQAQQALIANTTEGQIVELSIKQIESRGTAASF